MGDAAMNYDVRKTPGDLAWFTHDRFGMFIHFGLYSLAARHEWYKSRQLVPEEEYDKYFENFDPDMFDARKWAKAAKEAGMKYMVLTTKHHEGFCLFDTAYTDYKSTNTPFGRDIVREYVDACRAEGLKVGFYYSLIDWHHPDFPIDVLHPRRRDQNAEELDRGRDVKKYAEYMRNQVRELLTNYGKIDIIWFDYSYSADREVWDSNNKKPWMQFNGHKGKEQWESEKLIELTRSLQPGIIINNRTEVDQDIWTPEQISVNDWARDLNTGELLPWEACHTFSGSWGYFRDELTWKSPETLINLLITNVSYGGNFIMNVGPTGRGYFDYRAENALKVYADWMKYNSRSIYGCTKADESFVPLAGVKLTQSIDGKRLYIHLTEYPFKSFAVHGLAGKVKYAQFLHDYSQITFKTPDTFPMCVHYGVRKDNDLLYFQIPDVKPNVIIPVIEVILK